MTGVLAELAELAELERALAIEHRAVYGYGLVGGRLTGVELIAAQNGYVAHELRRDAIAALVTRFGGRPAAAAPAYAPAHPVQQRLEALALAVSMEAECAAAYVRIVAATDDTTLRRRASGWLRDSAVRGVGWRSLLGRTALAAAPPLPGLVLPAPDPAPTPTGSG